MFTIAQANKYQTFRDPKKDLLKLALMFVWSNTEKRKKGRFDEGKELLKT